LVAAALVACGGDDSSRANDGDGGSSGDASAGGDAASGDASAGGDAASGDAASGDAADARADASTPDGATSNRGFPAGAPWVSFYGSGAGVDFAKVASAFRVINIDADPANGIGSAGIQTMRAGGQNRVISYMNVGACESFRDYYANKPPGFESCVSSGALTTAYAGYPNEKWANLSNVAYRHLIVDFVAPRLAARGIDGFFLDNMEVVEHAANATDGPCDTACVQGGLDLVWELRQRFPDMLIVMQNATSDTTRLGTTHGVAYPSLLDGVSHEEVYTTGADPGSRTEMLAWKAMNLMVNGRAFWLAAEDYVGSCSAQAKAAEQTIAQQATTDGLSSYVTDASAMQTTPCFWSDFP
jgi:cysteinyl-tRNA synthetase